MKLLERSLGASDEPKEVRLNWSPTFSQLAFAAKPCRGVQNAGPRGFTRMGFDIWLATAQFKDGSAEIAVTVSLRIQKMDVHEKQKTSKL